MKPNQMIARLMAAELAESPEELKQMTEPELRAYFRLTAPIRERLRAQQQPVDPLWEWSCDWIRRTRHPKEQYPFPSKAVAALLIQIKEKINAEVSPVS